MSDWRHSSGDLIADRRFAYAEALFAEGEFLSAMDLFTQIIDIAPQWPPARFGLGKSALEAGDSVVAREALQAALALDPADRLGAAVLLARIDGKPAMPDAYVAALFDDYAPRFDSHLVEALEYRAPALLMTALAKIFRAKIVPEQSFSNGLDLGCGTGLMAMALGGACERLAGVDLSPAMLERARAMGLYERLICAELLSFLTSEQPASADLVIAADVFCYVSDLAPVFLEIARVLAPNGVLAFTTQVHDGEGVVMGADSRVHHAVAHIETRLADAGFIIAHQELASSRKDRGVMVPGAVFVATVGPQ